VVEIVPLIVVQGAVPTTKANEVAVNPMQQKPYTALEQQGRDLYTREGCYYCHSQMIRPMLPEYLRYGDASRAEEFIYDHPFQWGSKRTGPDLHRVGGKYPSLWHFQHMMDPRSTSQGSNMPTSLAPRTIDTAGAQEAGADAEARRAYTNRTSAEEPAPRNTIVADLRRTASMTGTRKIVALISYLRPGATGRGLSNEGPKTHAGRGNDVQTTLRGHGVHRLPIFALCSSWLLRADGAAFASRQGDFKPRSRHRCPMERRS
jgi:cytochrome c oxidase cbb3-type subunit I/II